jgi:hypothetical protein
MRKIRAAICQIEAHPAIFTSHISYLEEPFSPDDDLSLSHLQVRGIDVTTIQAQCKKAYIQWNETRLNSILEFLGSQDPIPDIILFPECSIPINSLPLLAKWSRSNSSTIIAGSHTPLKDPEHKAMYTAIGVEAKKLKQAVSSNSLNVMPLIRSGKVSLIPKALPSIFERDIVTQLPSQTGIPSLTTFPVTTQNGTQLRMLPLLCSDALIACNVDQNYELSCTISLDNKPHQFNSFFEGEVKKKRFVLYCNEARYGGSKIECAHDSRMQDWMVSALGNCMPQGECIAICDLDIDSPAVQVGAASPNRTHSLVCLSSITYEYSQTYEQMKQLADLSSKEQGTRAFELDKMARNPNLNHLQRARVNQLLNLDSKGVESSSWWNVLSKDCFIMGLNPLSDLESKLAALTSKSLDSLMTRANFADPNTSSVFMKYFAKCKGLSSESPEIQLQTDVIEVTSIVDREREVEFIHTFLDDRATSVLEVSGLEEIGKSATINKAITQSGVTSVLRIPIQPTSSLDYLIFSILKKGSGLPEPPYSLPVDILNTPSFQNALRACQVVIFERAHNLLDGGKSWREESLPLFLKNIMSLANDNHIKLIFETRRNILFDLAPNLRKNLRIVGLDKNLLNYGVSLFDSQLRQAGLIPSDLDIEAKKRIVSRLGGHPIGIALAADTAYYDGVDSIDAWLAERKGSLYALLSRLVKGLDLSDEDRILLKLLTLSRAPIPRESLAGSVPFTTGHLIRNLIAIGAVNVDPHSRIEIASVLRNYAESFDVSSDIAKNYHKNAAIAFENIAKASLNNISEFIEAEYHANLAGISVAIPFSLLDANEATARTLYSEQRYSEASAILRILLTKRRSVPILRLAACTAARTNDFKVALALADEVLSINRNDTYFLSEIAKIALTQYQSDTLASSVVALAKKHLAEDVSILVIEGRLHLRKGNLSDAENVFDKAVERTTRNPWPYYYLGVLQIRLGRIDKAQDILIAGETFFYENNLHNVNALSAIRTELAYAYLLSNNIDIAEKTISSLIEDENASPESARIYAAIMIKKEGIKSASKALAKLQAARGHSPFDNCQYHLFAGLFYLGINDPQSASHEFHMAHSYDKSNVYVMMKWARTLFEAAIDKFADSDEGYKVLITDCTELVKKILEFDPDNEEGIDIAVGLKNRFDIDINYSRK